MITELILNAYYIIAIIVLVATALQTIVGNEPEEITDFGSWAWYGLLFPLIIIKSLIRFIKAIIKS